MSTLAARPFARASRNPENPEFAASDLLEKVAGGAANSTRDVAPSSGPTQAVKMSRLSVYLAPEEHWHIRDKANANRMSINDYVRSILLADMK